jgi:hypothetical protein
MLSFFPFPIRPIGPIGLICPIYPLCPICPIRPHLPGLASRKGHPQPASGIQHPFRISPPNRQHQQRRYSVGRKHRRPLAHHHRPLQNSPHQFRSQNRPRLNRIIDRPTPLHRRPRPPHPHLSRTIRTHRQPLERSSRRTPRRQLHPHSTRPTVPLNRKVDPMARCQTETKITKLRKSSQHSQPAPSRSQSR